MSEKIKLIGISEYGRHGIYAHEKINKQKFEVDILMLLNRTSLADQINETVDYDLVTQQAREVIANNEYDLLETLANQIADMCLTFNPVNEVEVSVHKPAAARSLGIEDVVVIVNKTKK